MRHSTEDIISFISNYHNPLTADYLGISFQPLRKFITPETDLFLLTLLAKANAQGLDLVYVDINKLLNSHSGCIQIQYLTDEPAPWPGACYTRIDLSFLLYEGHSFICEGTAEGMGLDFTLNTQTLFMHVAEEFSDDSLEWMDCDIHTVNDLVRYLNGELKPLKTSDTDTVSKLDKSILFQVLYFIFMMPWWILKGLIKPIYTYAKELILEQRQPLGYRRK